MLGSRVNGAKSVKKSGPLVTDITSPADAARRRLKRIGDQVPKMADVESKLTAATELENAAKIRVDALVVLARSRGLTWYQIAARLGTTPQGAQARYTRAIKRFPPTT